MEDHRQLTPYRGHVLVSSVPGTSCGRILVYEGHIGLSELVLCA